MPLKPSLSAYLDLLRFTAALSVLFAHMDQDGIYMSWMPLSMFSHEAVMIFFVLSGFIIFYSTESRSSDWRRYAVARLSRIYSVAFPAVAICISLAFLLPLQSDFNPARLSNFGEASLSVVLNSLLFLNESWLNEVILPLNAPYWSLCYEVWFYVMFGCFYFARGSWRVLLVGFAALVAGPAILILLPVWLMGVVLAASGKYRAKMSVPIAWLAFLGPLVLVAVISYTSVDESIKKVLHDNVPGFWRLSSSQRFVTDYIVGFCLCIHIAAFSSLPVTVQCFFERRRVLLSGLAGFSFTLYLFHRPMTQLLAAYLPQHDDGIFMSISLAIGILLACWILSWITEKRLGEWRRAFSALLLRPKLIP